MKKAKTKSFVLTLKLNTSAEHEKILNLRFFVAFLMKNRLIGHARKALSSMKQDKEYRELMKQRQALKGKDNADAKAELNLVNKSLKEVRLQYGLSEYQFQAWIKVQQYRYKKDIDSMTAQKIATSVWQSVDTVLFRKGKSVHFKRLDDLLSLEGKQNTSCMRFKNNQFFWNGLVIQPQIRKNDAYAMEALTHRVKYCRVKRMAMGKTYHYYLQLILEGTPPQKYEMTEGRVGIDQGTSSEAVFSENGCILTELAPDAKNVEKDIRRLQRKMDRSKRANNPDHYNGDGTIKKTKKPWVKSRTYKTDQMRLKTIRRRNKATVKQAEQELANEILTTHGSDIVTEKMNYAALQKRAKEDRIDEKGRHRSKKRFGASIARHAPGKFMTILEQKLSYAGKEISYVDTWNFKASQYDHVLGKYEKKSLSTRSKMVGGHRVQRDLYSAFLLWGAFDKATVNRELCNRTFALFLKHQQECIDRLMGGGQQLSSFGLNDFM